MTKARYHRTMIKKLRVEGYRSLKLVELEDLEPLIVIHGPNGVGKSNIIRAIQYILHWATSSGPLPSRTNPRSIANASSTMSYRLNRDDFSRGQLPEMRIALEMQVGSFAAKFLGEADAEPYTLKLRAVAQDIGDDIFCWFEEALFGEYSLVEEDPATGNHSAEQKKVIAELVSIEQKILRDRAYIQEREQKLGKTAAGDASESGNIRQWEREIRLAESKKSELESQISREDLLLVRAKNVLFPQLVQHFAAYRNPFERDKYYGKDYPIEQRTIAEHELEGHFLASSISQDRHRRASVLQLTKRLQQAGFDAEAITPIWNRELDRSQLLISTKEQADIPLSQLGTGMQQLLLLIGGIFANPAAVTVIEEPEAHLYKDTMLSFASYLKQAVEETEDEPPEIDQLWLETHHHAFAIALEYLDVSKDEQGWTQVVKQPRSRAGEHFYEPKPFWDALLQLVQDVLEDDDVVFQDAAGEPVTAGTIRASIEGDRALANEYVDALTDMTIAAMRKKAMKGKG